MQGYGLTFERKKKGAPVFPIISGGALTSQAIFTRASSAGTWVNGVWVYFATNTPRFGSYDNSTYTGLIMEGAATNLCLNSNPTIVGGNWTENNATLTPNATTSSDGTANASTITMQAIAGGSGVYQAQSASAATTYTYSCFVKYVSGTAVSIRFGSDFSAGWGSGAAFLVTFNTATNTFSAVGSAVTSYSSLACANDWYRIQITGTTVIDATFTTFIIYTAEANTGIFGVWGCQIEANSFATSYIPTTSASVTRAADVCSISSVNTKPWFNVSEGTLFGDFRRYGDIAVDKVSMIACMNDGTSVNRIEIRQNNASNSRYVEGNITTSAVDIATLQESTGDANIRCKSALAFKVNDYAFSNNGDTVIADTNGAYPIGINLLEIGQVAFSSGNVIYGTIKSITYYPRRLPNATLQSITA